MYLFQQQVADKMDLHPTDFHSIHLLDKYGALTPGKLATYLGLTSGATTAVIDRLVGLGYVERVPSDSDRRSTLIRLQPDTIQKMRQEYSSVNEHVQSGLRQFSDAELDTIERFLQVLTSF